MKKFTLLSIIGLSSLAQAQTFKFLDTNMVSTRINTCSIRSYDMLSSAGYVVPKGSGIGADFASSLWIGGLDNLGQLHLASETYRQIGSDYSSGPLDTISASTNSVTVASFNKVWKISCNQVNQFVANANANNFISNTAPTFSDINTYQGNGNIAGNYAQVLAPFFESNGDGIYDPTIGEYPIIKGHQQLYTVYNDAYAPHTESQGLPLGVEVHERSYAYHLPVIADTMRVINYTTFYNYQVINRSNNNYNNVYMTVWSDPDLGYYLNDYIGTDTLNQFGYTYNATSTDPTYGGANGYGNKLPMFAYALIPRPGNQGDGIDNNNNGNIDEVGERFKLNFTTYYNNNIGPFPPATTNPDTKWQRYNYMSGRWKDSSFFKPGGTAYNPTLNVAPSRYVFTGNPQTNTGWTEATASVSPGDRRMICSIGPFNFPAKKKVEFEYAYIFSRDTSLNNVNANFSLLKRDVKNVRYFVSQQNDPYCLPPLNVGIKEQPYSEIGFWTYPNPAKTEIFVSLERDVNEASWMLYDMTGRKVLRGEIRHSSIAKLQVEHLSAGVYLLELRTEGSRAVRKLVKE